MTAARRTVPGWKAGLLIIGSLIAAFALLNMLAQRSIPQPDPKPSPTIIR